jgi:hypothetical protein
MFRWAQQADTVKTFLMICYVEETWVKSIDAGHHRVDVLPPCWMQAKSNIKRGWEQGLIPVTYDSYHAHREAKVKVGKTALAQPERDAPLVPGVAELIETGVVVDGKAAVPDDLREIEQLIRPLNQLARARVIKSMTETAQTARDDHDANIAEGKRRGAKDRARAANDPRNQRRDLFPGLKQSG